MILNILGAVNKGLGRVQAAAAFKKATSLNPHTLKASVTLVLLKIK